MSETRLLSVSLALSAILHVAILALPTVRVALDATWLGRSANTVLAATIVSQELVGQEATQGGLALPSPVPEYLGARQSTAPSSEVASGLRGQDEERPVVELSMSDYLPPSLLDKTPKPLGSIDTDIDFKGMRGVVGDAEIMLLISSDGGVDGVLVMNSSLPEFIVNEAVARFRGVPFEPGELHGVQVRSRVRIKLSPPGMDELLGNPYSAKEKAWRR